MKTHSTKTNGHKTTTHHAHGAADGEEAVEKTEEMPAQALIKSGAKGDASGSEASGASSADPATASDVELAAALMPWSGGTQRRPVSPKLVAQFANPQMQTDLNAIAQPLSAFDGCDVAENLALAQEGATLLGALERLNNSAGRVHQRLVFINRALLGFHTALGTAAQTAPAKSAVAKGLAPFADLRAADIATKKAARTRNASKKETQPSEPAPAPKGNGSSGSTPS